MQTKIWIQATRPFTLTASVIPVLLGGMLSLRTGTFSVGLLLLAILSMTALQVSSNLISDFDDYRNHVDTKASFGSSRMLVEGYLQPEEVLRVGIAFFVTGCMMGVLLFWLTGPAVLGFGLAGALSAFFYTRKPFSFKYRGLGIPFVFVMFGPLPVLGAYYVQTARLSLPALLLSIPVGLLTTAILHANDIRDIIHDREAGIRTFAMQIGQRRAGGIYLAFLLVAYMMVLLMIMLRVVSPWSAVVFLTLPLTVANLRCLRETDKLMALDQQTAKLQMLFGTALILSVTIP